MVIKVTPAYIKNMCVYLRICLKNLRNCGSWIRDSGLNFDSGQIRNVRTPCYRASGHPIGLGDPHRGKNVI